MGLRLFNTRTRTVQEFVPRDPSGRRVGMYCCGPTVYDIAHIGNFRTFTFADLVRRFLAFKGFEVRHVMNITDVDDKIIRRARETGQPRESFTRTLEAEFFADFDQLRCRRPDHLPRATEHIRQIIVLIERLVAAGLAYRAPDGSVYFSIEKYRARGNTYGQLVRLNFDEMRRGERTRNDEYEKDALADFALWKSRVPEDGSVFWPSPWGEGRPGWHIECSAMSMHYLGSSFDLHLGGEDLVFPHHEDEIAQSEGARAESPPEPFVRCWLHAAHLLVEGKKMSKSLGNFYTPRDLFSKGFDGREIRYLLLSTHYREPCNFTLESLKGARASLARLDECLGRLQDLAGEQRGSPDADLVHAFTEALDDDLNVSAGLGAVFQWVREQNRLLAAGSVTTSQAAAAITAWEQIDRVLDISARKAAETPAEVLALLEQRQAARQARDFARADALRDELKSRGWVLEDTPKGPRLKPV